MGTSSSAIVIPQTLSGAKLYITTEDDGTFVTTLTTTAFVSGMKYAYNVTVNQDGTLNKLYMMSGDPINVESGTVSITPEMKHLGGFILLTIELENADASNYEITEVKLSSVPTKLNAPMAGDFLSEPATFYNDMTDGTITATLSNKQFDENNELEVRLNTLPFTYAVDGELTFEITFKINSVEYTSKFIKTNTSESDILFQRAKFNYTTITLDETHITECTINDWGDGTEGESDLNATPYVEPSEI